MNGEIKEPTRKTLVEWIVKFVRERAPAPMSTIERSEIVSLTGLEWGSTDLEFVLITAKKELYRGTPAYEFKSNASGLYFLSAEERVWELTRRRREARARHAEAVASGLTIDASKLTDKDKARLEHEQRLNLHLYEESKRASRKRWIGQASTLEFGNSEAKT